MKEGQHNTASKSMAVEPGGLGLNHSSPITSEVSMAKSLNLSEAVLSSVRIIALSFLIC